MKKRPKFGATGEHPQGKLNKSDEGAIQLGIAHEKGKVIIQFGTPVAWLGMPPREALEFANLIVEHAHKATLEDKPDCICHETVMGKSECPVHGPHPAVEAANQGAKNG